MANMHVLSSGGGQVLVVMHIAIPSANNTVGVNWRTALIGSGIGGTTVLKDGDGTVGTISAAEKTAILSGAVYEISESLQPESTNLAGLPAWLDAQYTVRSAIALLDLQDRLKFFGYVRG